MWYALVDIRSEFHAESRLFFGEEKKHIAAQLAKQCDIAMQFDMEEMTMEEIDAYTIDGYDQYEALSKDPSLELFSAFRFRCNDASVSVFRLAEGYDGLREAFEGYAKGKLRGWKLVPYAEETEASLQKLARELQSLANGTVPEKLEFFEKA